MPALRWKSCRFDELSAREMFDLLKLRQDVFVVEQNCVYHDIDILDPLSMHIFALDANDAVVAYVRLVPPGLKYAEPAIGRVVVAENARGQKLGKDLMEFALSVADHVYPEQGNRISAQQHLSEFYGAFGYKVVSDVYDEDGIPHVEMLRAASM